MTTKWKLITSLVVLVAIFLSGYYSGRGQREVVTVEKEGKIVTVVRDHIITVTKTVQPDGTVTETTKTEDKDSNSTAETKESDSSSRSLASNYSVGLKFWQKYAERTYSFSSKEHYEVQLGRRIAGDVWGDIGVKTDSVALGLRINW